MYAIMYALSPSPLPISPLRLLRLSGVWEEEEGEEDEPDRFWRVPSHPTSIPSSSPPIRVPSSESHHALVSVFPVELQEDEGRATLRPV